MGTLPEHSPGTREPWWVGSNTHLRHMEGTWWHGSPICHWQAWGILVHWDLGTYSPSRMLLYVKLFFWVVYWIIFRYQNYRETALKIPKTRWENLTYLNHRSLEWAKTGLLDSNLSNQTTDVPDHWRSRGEHTKSSRSASNQEMSPPWRTTQVQPSIWASLWTLNWDKRASTLVCGFSNCKMRLLLKERWPWNKSPSEV